MNQTQHCYTHYLEYHKWVTLYSFLSMIIICFSHKQFHRLVWNDTSSSNLRLIKSRNKNIPNPKKKQKWKKKKKDRNPNNLFNIDKAKLKTKKNYWCTLLIRCIQKKGKHAPKCEKFADYYRSMCPLEWVRNNQCIYSYDIFIEFLCYG